MIRYGSSAASAGSVSPPAPRIQVGSMKRERSSTGCVPSLLSSCRAPAICGTPGIARFAYRAFARRLARQHETDRRLSAIGLDGMREGREIAVVATH